MKSMKLSLAVLVLLIASTATAKEVSKDTWIKHMSTALPEDFCRSERYFRQCFKVTQKECDKTARSATKKCLEEHKDKIPARLKQPQDGTTWGSVVGSCAGSAYEMALQKKRINNSKCNNPNNWK